MHTILRLARPLLLALAATATFTAASPARAGDIGGFGFMPRVGTANYFSTTSVSNVPNVGERHHLLVELGLDFGSTGFHFELTPYYISPDFKGSGLQGAGLGMGFLGRFGLIDRLYMGIGVNVRSGGLWGGTGLGLGFESYARLPVEFMYYVVDDLAIVAQVAPGYGLTGAKSDFTGDFGIGRGWLIDWGVGIRVP